MKVIKEELVTDANGTKRVKTLDNGIKIELMEQPTAAWRTANKGKPSATLKEINYEDEINDLKSRVTALEKP